MPRPKKNFTLKSPESLKIERLTRELAEMKDSRDELNLISCDQAARINSMTIKMGELSRSKRNLMRAMLRRDLEIARLGGYIHRIREADGVLVSNAEFDPAITAEGLLDMNDEDFDNIMEDRPRDLKGILGAWSDG